MYCPECGKEVIDRFKFCPHCGCSLESAQLLIQKTPHSCETALREKAYNVQTVRQTYKKAYEKWTPDEDKELATNYNQGLTISQLAEKHQRKEGAIRSRLTKLGLMTP